MSTLTTNFGLNKDGENEWYDVVKVNQNTDKIDEALGNVAKFEKAGGTATAITLTGIELVDGLSKSFIVKANNNAAATTINGKPLYKPDTTSAPSLTTGKAVTIWYDLTGDCFFIKASAEGDAVAANVLAEKKFSNDNDTGITGTMPNNGAVTLTPGTADKAISLGYHNGSGKVLGDPNLVPSKVLLNNTIFGITGTGVGVNKCAQISGLTGVFASVVQGQVVLNWTNPSDGLIKGVRILYKTGSYPTGPTDGTVFYDSNDGAIPSTFTKVLTEGTTYYFRAFAYTYQNATRIYTTTTTGAQVSGMPYRVQGTQIFTSSGTFVIPANVTSIDIFCVGGGSGGNAQGSDGFGGGGGGGGGYTASKLAASVTPGTEYAVTIGAGGNGATNIGGYGGNGGTTSFGTLLSALGGTTGNGWVSGNNGGSGGGVAAMTNGGNYSAAGSGGTDGSNGNYNNSGTRGVGQHTTTRAFAESANTLYSGGGGGGRYYGYAEAVGGAGGGGNGGNAAAGSNCGANTGGGGGGGAMGYAGGNGGSGICIVRWGY